MKWKKQLQNKSKEIKTSHFLHSHSDHEHGHVHGVLDPSLLKNKKGLWALKWSFVALMITALFQSVVVYYSGSVALLADTIHNFADASTALPLALAFIFASKKPNLRFAYGYGRLEDLAGIFIVGIIFFSASVAAYQSIERLIYFKPMHHVEAVMIASIFGFIGNEAVAWFRIKIGKEIHSAALVADGYHARIDALTSLGVFLERLQAILGFQF